MPGGLPAELDRCFFGELGGFTSLPGSGDPQSSPVCVAHTGQAVRPEPTKRSGREEGLRLGPPGGGACAGGNEK